MRELGDQIVDGRPGNSDPCERTAGQVYGVRMSYFRLKFLVKFLNNFLNHLGPLSVLVVGGWSR